MCLMCSCDALVDTMGTETRFATTVPFIKKPEYIADRIFDKRDGKPSMQVQMGLCDEACVHLWTSLQEAGRRHFDFNKPFRGQTHQSYQSYLAAAHGKCNVLRRFEAAWPAEAYARLYIKHRRGNLKQVKKRERALRGTRTQTQTQTRTRTRTHPMRTRASHATNKTYPKPHTAPVRMMPIVLVSQRSGRRVPANLQIQEVVDRRTPSTSPSESTTDECTIEEFLRNMDPPQRRLIPVFRLAGVDDTSYLRTLAKNPDALKEFLESLRADGQVQRVQVPILKSAILATFGPGRVIPH